MAIVAEYVFGSTHVLIDDSAYVNATPEELKRVQDDFQSAACHILEGYVRRQAEKQNQEQQEHKDILS